jgi:hypothetical protein
VLKSLKSIVFISDVICFSNFVKFLRDPGYAVFGFTVLCFETLNTVSVSSCLGLFSLVLFSLFIFLRNISIGSKFSSSSFSIVSWLLSDFFCSEKKLFLGNCPVCFWTNYFSVSMTIFTDFLYTYPLLLGISL